MKILLAPDPFLKKVAAPVKNYDKKLQTQIDDMIKILKSAQDPEGVGLAATQVGLDKRLLILDLKGHLEIIINPEIIDQSEATLAQIYKKTKDRWLEGCLSLPRLWGFVDRPYWVDINYFTPQKGVLVAKSRRFEDIESSYFLHEFDHLNGILFTDRILEQKGKILQETPDGLTPIRL